MGGRLAGIPIISSASFLNKLICSDVRRNAQRKVRPLPVTSKTEVKYCTGCGAPIERVVRLRFCPYCGSKDEGKRFCAECGSSLQDLQTSIPAAETAMPMVTSMLTPTVQPSSALTPQTTMPAQTVGSTATAPQNTWSGQPATTAKLAKAYCPDCGNEATWVSVYSQWYCYTDQKYVSQPTYTEPKKGLFRR